MTETTKRVPLAEYPGADEDVWIVAEESGRLVRLDWFARDRGVPIEVTRHREPSTSDLHRYGYGEDVYEALSEMIETDDDLSWDDGNPVMPRWETLPDDLRAEWESLAMRTIERACDLSEAGWPPTGERVRVYPDGTVERIDAGGEP